MEEEVNKSPDIVLKNSSYINISPIAPVAKLASEESSTSSLGIPERMLKDYLDNPSKIMIDQMKELVTDPFSINVYKDFVHLLTSKRNLPLVFHCRGGKDRAGYAAILTLLILDVDIKEIKKDYLFTNVANKEKNIEKYNNYKKNISDPKILKLRKELMLAKESYFDIVIKTMEELSGSSAKYLNDYLEIDEQKKNIIKNNLLE